MATEHLIPLEQLSTLYHIEFSFIDSLNEFGLIDVLTVENTRFIHEEQLTSLEKLVRLHYDLEINMEGIDAITNMLKQVDNLQEEIMMLRNRLRLYESETKNKE